MKIWIGCGIICVLRVLHSLWYAATFNAFRLVVPMDFKNYVFEIRDLPTIVSVFFTCIYLAMLFVMLFTHTGKEQRQAEETGITRKINSKLGYLGVLGFWVFYCTDMTMKTRQSKARNRIWQNLNAD